jgi:hypothetical protein
MARTSDPLPFRVRGSTPRRRREVLPEPEERRERRGGGSGEDATLDTRTFAIGVAAVTLLALLLRMYRLDEWALWVDEAHTFRDVTGDAAVFWERSHVSRYPLSYMMLRALLPWFPSVGEGWLRLPFALFGIASIPALALVARQLVGMRAALVGALLLAVHPWHLYWSQNVRSYAMVVFFAILAAGAGHEAIRRRSLWFAAGAALASALSGFSHPSGHGMFFVLGLSTVLAAYSAGDRLTRRGKQMLRWMVVSTIVAVLLTAPLLAPALEFFTRAKGGASPIHLAQTLVYFLRVAWIPVALLGAAWMFRSRRLPRRRAAWLVTTWAVLPPLLLVLATFLFGFQVTAQYAFTALPAWCLLAAVCIVEAYDLLRAAIARSSVWSGGRDEEDPVLEPATGVRGRVQRGFDRVAPRAIAAVLGVVLVADALSYDVLYFGPQHGDRPRWREAALAVLSDADASDSGPGLRVLTTNWPTMRYYLASGSFWGRDRADRELESIEDFVIANEHDGDAAAWLLAERERAARTGQALYVVSTQPELDQKHADLDRLLREAGHQIERLPCWTGPKDMTVQVFRLAPLPAEALAEPEVPIEPEPLPAEVGGVGRREVR